MFKLEVNLDFKLRRLILLDSYSPGGEAILDLADGAILTGDNGAGKTSLLSLIPIFYGENPGRCTSGYSSFADFYLPNSTSYVIFEYSRRGHAYMAILYGVGEGSFNYRFIRGAYDLNLFTENGDGSTIIPAHDLKVRLKTVGVLHSPVMSISEYRNIIQGRVAGGHNFAESRALVAEYAFTDSGSKLVHIEKIVSGMFSRTVNFDDILRVIVDYISDDGNAAISITGVREQYAEWPSQFAAYNEVMQHAGVMAEVEGIDSRLKANSHELRLLHGKLLLLGQHYAAQHAQASAEHAELGSIQGKEQAEFNEALLQIQRSIAKAGADANEADERIQAIDAQAEGYARDNIAEKAGGVSRIPEMQASISTLGVRKDTLLGEYSKIEQQYQALAIVAEKEFLTSANGFNTQIEAARAQCEPKLAANRLSFQNEDRALQDGADGKFRALRLKRDEVLKQVVHWQEAVKNPVPAPELAKAQEKKLDEQGKAYEALQLAQAARRNLDNGKLAAMRAYSVQDGEFSQLRQRLSDVGVEEQRLLAHLNPDKDSLLHFLRASKSDWTTNIARVIRDDVLSMKALSPSLEGDGETLYGVSLDLGRIETPLCANEAALQEKLSSCRNEQGVLKKDIEVAETQLAALDKQRAEADAALTTHDIEVAGLTARLESLKKDVAVARRAVEDSINNARRQAQQQLKLTQEGIEECDRLIRAEDESLKRQRQDCAAHHNALEKTIREKRDDAVREIRVSLDNTTKSHRQRLEQLGVEKEKVLSERGVDTKMLQRIDTEIDGLMKLIQDGEDWRERVNTWRFWQQNELPNREKYAETARNCKEIKKTADGDEKALADRWSTRLAEMQSKLSALDGNIRALTRDQDNIRNKVQQMADFPPSPTDMAHELDATWTAGGLFGQAIGLFSDRKALQAELGVHIRRIKASFSNVRGSPTEQYFSTMRAAVDPDDSNPAAWVKPLRDWFSREHEARRHILMMQASAYGALISDFHDKLVRFHKDVIRFNNDIQRALNQVNVFRCISNVVIQFDSALDKLKYWGDVTDFNKVYQDWKASRTDMPPPEFAEGLKRLISHWEVREGIRAERRSLINIHGEVVENGNHKAFRTTADLEKLSSNGLSYLILCTIFVAFVRKIRGDAKVQITWSVDELLDLDTRNIRDLLVMLTENGIRLVSACPEANIEILDQFAKAYRIQRTAGHPEIVEFDVDLGGDDV